jgi:L-lactate dehydrogenase complex protein LldG
MSSRDEILKAIRSHLMEAVDLPDLQQEWIRYSDPLAQFVGMLASVGGRCVMADHPEAANAELAQVPAYREAKKIVSLVPGIGSANVDLGAIGDPHDLEDVDYAILPGDFAVAENAAVWVTDAGIKHRVIFVLPQHLALVVPADQILHNMHEAYDWLAQHPRPDGNPQFDQAGFGAFISGPSKTADIEQSLVIGAHGARSLTVILLKSKSL